MVDWKTRCRRVFGANEEGGYPIPATRLRVFISSVQKEFSQLRQDLKAFLLGDAVLRRFIADVFLFEELPAGDRPADRVYLDELERSDIYLGFFGYDYGAEDQEGISPTEREFDHATKHDKTRLVYVWGSDEKKRSPKMKKLVNKASGELIRRRVEDYNALTSEVYSSMVDYLDRTGALRVPPFDTSACDGATLDHLSRKRIDWFLDTARRERGFPLRMKTETAALLTHLNLLHGDTPTNAAILLFGAQPQRFHRPAETKCVHCHGIEYRRPFASQQIYGGDLFEQTDQACDFALSKINRTVGVRSSGPTAPAEYELPPDAVGEAIVNAIAHRDYNSNASVEVRLFSDRLEVWNPGDLPGTLSPESLRQDHPSIPNNPFIAESLYLARYIEKAGSGTQAMIELCREEGLPEPRFERRQGSFVVTLWRDWLTEALMEELGLNERQRGGLAYVKEHGRIANRDYQDLSGLEARMATRDLHSLVRLGLLKMVGATGRNVYYILGRKADVNPPHDGA
jgi:predicted HTH transcriptional regulator